MGLWLLEDADQGDRVARYTGDLIDAEQAAKSRSPYLLMINRRQVLDATDPSHEKGRYVNDGKVAGRRVNAAFGAGSRPILCKDTGRYYVSIRATRRIKAGTEILVSYGPAYWGKDGFSLQGRRPARRKVPPTPGTSPATSTA